MDYSELLKAVMLGILQGLTEFLPISSSGHLVIASQYLDFQEQGVLFDIFLHLGTLVAVVLAFRKELVLMGMAPVRLVQRRAEKKDRYYFLWDVYVVLATLPTVVIGLLVKDHATSLFTNLIVVYGMLLVTAVLMLACRYLKERDEPLGWRYAFIIGCAQACAIMPGLSRSGATLFAGMSLGINRETAARFSFILSIPAIVGAAVLHLPELLALSTMSLEAVGYVVAGMTMAAFSGYFAIVVLLDVVRRNRLQYFGYYCIFVAIIGLSLQLFRG